ncbi:MAG: hypothetical protein PHO89_00350 [Methylacidiphilaceae bacterium]|nr:hypothetical protein [Candidatus Methylacidiphilaceae bacterium]
MDLLPLPLTGPVVDSTQLPQDSLADWREAASRLDAYLARWQLADPFYQRVIGASLLALAIREQEKSPQGSPVEQTMKLAQQRVAGWLDRLPSGSKTDVADPVATATLGLYLADGLDHWPRAFLSESIPAELAERLRRIAFEPGPSVRFSHMVSRPIDYGPLARLAREAWEQVGWREVLAILLFWASLFGAACAVYFLFFFS